MKTAVRRPSEVTPTIAALALSVAAMIVVLAHGPAWLTVPSGLLLVLVLPGFVWTRAFQPSGVAPFGAAGFVLAVSLGTTMVVGIGINALSAGLTRTDWCIGQEMSVVLGVLAVLARREPVGQSAQPPRVRLTAVGVTVLKLLPLAVLLALAVLVSIRSQSGYDSAQHFTVLSIRADGQRPVVTVSNHEGAGVSYRLAARVNGRAIASRNVPVASGRTVAVTLTLPPAPLRGSATLRVILDRAGRATAYRTVWLHSRLGIWG